MDPTAKAYPVTKADYVIKEVIGMCRAKCSGRNQSMLVMLMRSKTHTRLAIQKAKAPRQQFTPHCVCHSTRQ
jgi:hypothetical protein